MPKLKISEPGKKSKSYTIKITRETITLGRKDSNDIILTDISVSSFHAKIRRVEGGYVLDDLESTNGSKIDGQRYIKMDLDVDTAFKLGDVTVDFIFTDDDCDVLDEEDKFESEQEKKLSPKQQEKLDRKNKRKKKKSGDEDEEEEDDIDEDYDDDDEGGNGTFLITVVAFVATIAIAILILYFTGNLF